MFHACARVLETVGAVLVLERLEVALWWIEDVRLLQLEYIGKQENSAKNKKRTLSASQKAILENSSDDTTP
jgi:hypothetical protein